MYSLVTSIFLYACESWALTAELQRRIQAMELRCYCKILYISYKDHVTNKEVHAKILQAIGPHKDFLTIVKRRKLQWYGHVSRSSDLAKTILQGTVKGRRRQGRQRKRWEDNIRKWTGLEFVKSQRAVENRKKKLEKTGCKIFGGAPTTLAVKGLMMMMIYRSDGREMLRGRKFNDGTVDVHYQSPSSDHSERGGKITSENGQASTSPSPRGQWRTGKKWRKLVMKLYVVPLRPSRLRDR